MRGWVQEGIMGLGLALCRWSLAVLLSLGLWGAAICRAQAVNGTLPDAPTPQNPNGDNREAGQASSPQSGRDASSQGSAPQRTPSPAVHWLLGSAVTSDRELEPLTNSERFRLYLRQTYFNPGSYAKRIAGGAIDQARDVPHQWGQGWEAYGKRVGSRYGQFVIQNTLKSAGDAAVGYEPRYDLCRCQGFWPRTKHSIIRNFVTYNSTERELRPQIPLYSAAFVAGMTASTWKPGPQNLQSAGLNAVAQQAGWGILTNWLSEFSGDIGKKLSRKH
jgi:hypothetical protein